MTFILKATPTAATRPITIAPMPVAVRSRPMRVLDLDIENRPLSYLGSDFTTAEVTAIAWAWCDRPDDVSSVLLGEVDPVEMLTRFRAAYDAADMVTGHYITGHDLIHLNAAFMEYQLPTLADKMVQDTKVHLVRRKGLSSSQENLAAMLLLEHDKVKMNQAKWRAANRLTAEGREETRKRVVGDVQQHIELRQRLIDLGYLGPAVKWRSGVVAAEPVYTP